MCGLTIRWCYEMNVATSKQSYYKMMFWNERSYVKTGLTQHYYRKYVNVCKASMSPGSNIRFTVGKYLVQKVPVDWWSAPCILCACSMLVFRFPINTPVVCMLEIRRSLTLRREHQLRHYGGRVQRFRVARRSWEYVRTCGSPRAWLLWSRLDG